MQIRVGVLRHVIVKSNVNALNIHPTTKQISSHQDPPLEIFKLLITR